MCCFWPSILKLPKGQKHLYCPFHSSLALLINHYTQLGYLQKNNFGHTKSYLLAYLKNSDIITWTCDVRSIDLLANNVLNKRLIFFTFFLGIYYPDFAQWSGLPNSVQKRLSNCLPKTFISYFFQNYKENLWKIEIGNL